jgi:predicted ribonuclease YlaK
MFASVVESLRWTVIVPLPVVMELDGLAVNVSPLGEAAQAALAYITSRLRSHAASLKVQTSKGNYLATLSVRTEQIDFHDNVAHERNMDDLILKAAIWQEDHWVDRSSLLKEVEVTLDKSRAVKVVLLSLDRNRKCTPF